MRATPSLNGVETRRASIVSRLSQDLGHLAPSFALSQWPGAALPGVSRGHEGTILSTCRSQADPTACGFRDAPALDEKRAP